VTPDPHAIRPFSYVVPIATQGRPAGAELTRYLMGLALQAEVIVVDGSPADVFEEHHRRWSPFATHIAPETRTLFGKVGGVLTGVERAANERVVVADDDVRYGDEIHDLLDRLDGAEVARPQNYFDPLPWHAVWDSGRSLINRLTGGDWPGTLAVRRSALLATGGYAGDVMFENYEMCATIEAAGGRHVLADDIFVRRLPPTVPHFWSQRVRQAYDEWCRPARLIAWSAVAPAFVVGVLRRPPGRRARTVGRLTTGFWAAAVLAAEAGRRQRGARRYFPLRCSLAAPLWLVERSVCTWAAIYARARGGVRYRDSRIRRAALTRRQRKAWLDPGPSGVVSR
jgi:hypothetical protein